MEVCTVEFAAKRLRKSVRQIYRYIHEDQVKAYGKFLGEWLLSLKSVEDMGKHPLQVQPLPKSLQKLLPEYSINELNAGRDETLIIGRVLQEGTTQNLRWLFKRFRKKRICNFVKGEGARVLSKRALRFWSLYFNVRADARDPMRESDRIWQNR